MQLTGATAPRFRIVNVTLPAGAQHEHKLVPMLLDDRTGPLARSALRWMMRSRRNAVTADGFLLQNEVLWHWPEAAGKQGGLPGLRPG